MFLDCKNIQEKLSSFISPSRFNVTGNGFFITLYFHDYILVNYKYFNYLLDVSIEIVPSVLFCIKLSRVLSGNSPFT